MIQEEENKDVIQEETTEAETPTLDEDSVAMPPPPEKALEIEKMEEQKLKSKFPGMNNKMFFRSDSPNFQIISNFFLYKFQLLAAVQVVEDSPPSSRRDWVKGRSTLTLVTIRWPSREAAWAEVRAN